MVQFQSWLGSWSGVKRLWLTPDSDEIRSNSKAQIEKVVKGKFLQISYEWQLEQEPQEGVIILPVSVDEEETHSVWLDSWHTRHNMMVCVAAKHNEKVAMMGTYQAPPDADWGWRLEISNPGEHELTIKMFNISPECEECLAVEFEYEPSF